MAKINDVKTIKNSKVGKLTVAGYSHTTSEIKYYICKCDCGRERLVGHLDLVDENILNCGMC